MLGKWNTTHIGTSIKNCRTEWISIFEDHLIDTSGNVMYEDNLDEFSSAALNAIRYISTSDKGKDMINLLMISDFDYNIEYNLNANSFAPFDTKGAHAYARNENPDNQTYGSGGTISWDFHGAMDMTAQGEQNNPAINLAHELSHAMDAHFGLLDNRYFDLVKNRNGRLSFVKMRFEKN